RVAVRADRPHIAARHTRVGQHGDRRVGEPATQVEREAAVVARGPCRERSVQSIALRRRVRKTAERKELCIDAPGSCIVVESYYSRRDAVERRTGHEPDVDAHAAALTCARAAAAGALRGGSRRPLARAPPPRRGATARAVASRSPS